MVYENSFTINIPICDITYKKTNFSPRHLHDRRKVGEVCNGDITRSSSRVDIGRVVEISFQILRHQVSGRCDLTPRRRLMTGDAAAAVDGWIEFRADHLSARRSTTDLTPGVDTTARDQSPTLHPRRLVVRHYICLHSIARLRVTSVVRERRVPRSTRLNDKS